MTAFGWGYISGSNINGPTNSVQFKKAASELSGSTKLTYEPSGSVLTLTGTLKFGSTGVALALPDGVRVSGLPAGFSGNRRLIDYDELIPSNVVAEIYGPITIASGSSLTVGASSHVVVKAWPYE